MELSIEGYHSSLRGGGAGPVKTNEVDIHFGPKVYPSFRVSYKYQIVPGTLTLTPFVMTFEVYPGQIKA